jgi:hypothetical protein
MTKKKPEKKAPTILLMFIQRCVLRGGKEGRIYYEIAPGEFEAGVFTKEPEELVYSGKSMSKYMGGSAGIVYEVPSPEPGSIITGQASYHGMWPNAEQRAEWQMLDQTVGQQLALRKAHQKAKRDDSVLECLEPIRGPINGPGAPSAA